MCALPGTEISTELALLQGWTELALEVELHGWTELALDELWVAEALPKCTVLAASSFHGRGVRIFKWGSQLGLGSHRPLLTLLLLLLL